MSENKPWWKTIPAILAGLATLITAITGLVIAINSNEQPESILDPNPVVEIEEVRKPPQKEIPCNLPDLEINQLSFNNGKVNVKIKNVGSSVANIDDNVMLQGYWSEDGKLKDGGAGGWKLKKLIQGSLAPGQSFQHSWEPSATINKPYLMMIVDSNYTLDECSEGNNNKVITI